MHFFQLSADSSILQENPFRDGGKLSQDAEDIVLAVKTGKLSVVSGGLGQEAGSTTHSADYQVSPSLVKPCNRKNAVIENIPNPTTSTTKVQNLETSHKSEKKYKKCCTVSWLLHQDCLYFTLNLIFAFPCNKMYKYWSIQPTWNLRSNIYMN